MTIDTSNGLTRRTALVTGAASGIGEATSRMLAMEGAHVACADLDFEAAAAVARTITEEGGDAFAVEVDVADPESNAALVSAVQSRFGALHIAVLNAGITGFSPVDSVSLDEWDRVMAVNLRGTFIGLQTSAHAIADAGGGSIILTSSVGGLIGSGGSVAYCVSKHGLVGLARCAAVDLSAKGVRVNAVCPGAIHTPILGSLYGDVEAVDSLLGRAHPIGRVGRAEEVASTITFLASDAASFITGAAIPVDGGVTGALPSFGRVAAKIEATG